ncbi:MAG: hypothetical protein NC301_07715 [Bacteroides sp.]|nr:hypothetical protein [Bacteroides sp.]MCM1380031.1 hypothetical protein [Bacteroides sp.]MCM1446374.1 hypothetical protein [Prevotella sp.]
MATQYQNYKSDFVLRQSFEDITGAPYPLPADIDFTLRYWTQHGREYVASRQGGVYTNCAPEGDALLVFFKDHNLCEGELHNELHLPLDNPLFEGGTQNVFYPTNPHILLWDKASSTDKLTSSLVADYTRGRAFAFDDFTPEQIEQLQQPAKEAADRYEAAMADYDRKASEQVGRIDEAATELECMVKEFAKESTELTEQMAAATKAANTTIADAERRTSAAVQTAQTTTAEATAAKEAADAAARRAIIAQQAADNAAQEAADKASKADKATQAATKAATDAAAATQAASGAAADATANATAAGQAAANARNAISTIDQVASDTRNIAERAEAAALAATEAKQAAERATEAANIAKTGAANAAATARQAKTKADTAAANAIATAQLAEAATQATEQERAILVGLIERAKVVTAGVPTGMVVESPESITIGNPVKQYVHGRVLPTSTQQNVLYLADGKAVDVLPDGEIVPKAKGISTVHVIPTDATRFYKTIQVETVAPSVRTAGSSMRLDKHGNIRLT